MGGSIDGTSLLIAYTIRTWFGRRNSNIRFRTEAAIATSVAPISSVRDRGASPITRRYGIEVAMDKCVSGKEILSLPG
jgi:hypothetical protein